MWQAIKLTFGSVWGWLGIIVGAISLINLGVMYFDVGIGPVLERVVATYKAIVHQGFDYLFFWIDWKMPPWAKDVAALYLVFAAASVRGGRATLNHFGSQPKAAWLDDGVLWPEQLFWAVGQVLAIIKGARHTKTVAYMNDKAYAALLNFLVVPLAAFLFVLVETGA